MLTGVERNNLVGGLALKGVVIALQATNRHVSGRFVQNNVGIGAPETEAVDTNAPKAGKRPVKHFPRNLTVLANITVHNVLAAIP